MATQSTPAQRKTNILGWLRAVRARHASYSFRSVQALLKSVGMPSAAGWTPLLAKYDSLNYADAQMDWGRLETAIAEMFNGSRYAGTTAVWLFDAPPGQLVLLEALIQLGSGPMQQAFPYTVADDVIAVQPFQTEFVAKIALGTAQTVFVACGKRAFRTREQLDPEDVSTETREEFGSFQEIIIVKAGYTQAFDRIAIRPLVNRMEIHLDLCCPLNTQELSQLSLAYTEKMKALLKAAGETSVEWLNTPLNIFPKIKALYDTNDGRVISLGHATSTKSIKEEKMRGQKLDLREEPFHVNGLSAVPTTDAFAIKKGWPTPLGNAPSIYIPGNSGNAGSPVPTVHFAILENCATMADYETLLQRLN